MHYAGNIIALLLCTSFTGKPDTTQAVPTWTLGSSSIACHGAVVIPTSLRLK